MTSQPPKWHGADYSARRVEAIRTRPPVYRQNRVLNDDIDWLLEEIDWLGQLLAERGTHSPDENCTCEPGDLARKGICEYRMLADVVGAAFNSPDGDAADVSILITAVERAAEFIRRQRCYCLPDDDSEPCRRCAVLGEFKREPVSR